MPGKVPLRFWTERLTPTGAVLFMPSRGRLAICPTLWSQERYNTFDLCRWGAVLPSLITRCVMEVLIVKLLTREAQCPSLLG